MGTAAMTDPLDHEQKLCQPSSTKDTILLESVMDTTQITHVMRDMHSRLAATGDTTANNSTSPRPAPQVRSLLACLEVALHVGPIH